jgi:hypothetical protein
MKILCAWCNKVIGGRGAAVSHGICRSCFQDVFQDQFTFMASVPSGPTSQRGHRLVRRRAAAVPEMALPGLFE